MSFNNILPQIPFEEAASYFVKLKYGSALEPSEAQVLDALATLPASEQAEILKEASANDSGMAAKLKEYVASKTKTAEEPPSMEAYLANEQQAVAAEEAGQVEFLRSRSQQLQQQLQQAQQMGAASEGQMQQLQQQLAMSTQQIQMSQQSAVAAQQQAIQAQQQQLQAGDDSLRTQQLAAQMRMAYQQLRGSMMDLATQDPAQSIGNEMKGQAPEMGGLPSPSASPMGGPQPGPQGESAQLGPASVPAAEDPAPQANAANGQPTAQGMSPSSMKVGNDIQAQKALLNKEDPAAPQGTGSFSAALQKAKQMLQPAVGEGVSMPADISGTLNDPSVNAPQGAEG